MVWNKAHALNTISQLFIAQLIICMHHYNTKRKPLILRAYGRNVQKFVETIHNMTDKAARTRRAKDVLQFMTILDAKNKYNSVDNTQKRWDDLFIISGHTLDVDSPYPRPEKSLRSMPLKKPAYTKQSIKMKKYGRNVERLIQKAACTVDPEEQEQLTLCAVKLMRNLGSDRHNENVDYNTLIANIQYIAGQKLMVDFEKLKVQNAFGSLHKDKNKSRKMRHSTGKNRRTL